MGSLGCKKYCSPNGKFKENFLGGSEAMLLNYEIVQNLSCRLSLGTKFNSVHSSHENQGPKIYSLEDRKP